MSFKLISKILVLFLIFLPSFIESGITKNEKNKLSKDELLEILKKDYLNKSNENYYILGVGDQIQVTVSPDYPELNSISFIDGEGFISLPKIKRVFVDGLTIEEFNLLLNQKYSNFVKYPNVSSIISSYRPINIFVDGEVNNPGIYSLRGSLGILGDLGGTNVTFQSRTITNERDLFINNNKNNYFGQSTEKLSTINKVSFSFPTLFDALRVSGGLTEYSDLTNISIIRVNSISNGGGKIIAKIDITNNLLKNGKLNNIRIYDDDIIKIRKLKEGSRSNINNAIRSNLNPKFVRVFVSGRVNQPGLKVLGKISTLNDAIDIAGGPKLIKGYISFLSYKNDGTIEKRKIKYKRSSKRGSYRNPYLSEGDLIIVGNSLLSNSTEFIKEVTAPFQGLYSTYSLIDALYN